MENGTPSARPPEPSEFGGLTEMLDGVFRSGGGSMVRDYPRFLNERNRFNLRVVVESGRVVSHAGILVRDAWLEGVCVRVALLGSVATHPDFRVRGCAGACVRACLERAVECGAEVMWISGDRPLYRRLGARPVGDDVELDMSAEDLARLARPEIDVRPLTGEHLLDAAEQYSREPVRFLRPLEDWQSALRSGFAMDTPCLFLGAWESGRLAAYAVVRRPGPEGVSLVVEYAGARSALLAALPRVLEEAGGSVLRLHLAHHDRTLSWRLAAAGFAGRPVATAGTAVVVQFASLMAKLRCRFLERAGEAAASELSYAEEGPPLGAENLFRIACGPDVVRADGRGTLTEFLFGKPGCTARLLAAREDEAPGGGPGEDAAPATADGEGAEHDACVLLWGAAGPFRAALPAPALWYGLNFV